MSLHARKHRLVVSPTEQTEAAAEVVSIQLRAQEGNAQTPSVTEFYRGSQEAGGESHLEETAPVPVAVDYAKPARFAADDITLTHFPYFASQGGSATTVAQLDTSSGVYENIWSGPTLTGAVKSFTMEDQGDPSVTDTDINRVALNCTPSRVSITGQRRGVITVAVDIQGGSASGNGSAPTAGTFTRGKLFHFGYVHIFTEAVDLGVGALSSFFGGDMTTDALVLTKSHLGGTPVSLTAASHQFAIDITQDLDLQNSMAPGNVTSSDAGYVPASGDWVYGEGQQQVEFELRFRQNHSAGSNLVETLQAEYEAGTRRSWEIWLVDPVTQAGATTGAHFGFKASLYSAGPVTGGYSEESDGLGERYVRCRYRAGWNTTDNLGWHFATGSSLNDSYGD